MHDVEKSKYFYRGRSQNWKTWKFAIWPHAHAATHIDIKHTFHNFKNGFSSSGRCHRSAHLQTQNLQHQRFTRYRAVKWIQILKTKKIFRKKFLASTTTKKYAEYIGEIRS